MSDVDPWRFQRWAFDAHTGNSTRKAVLSMLAMMADMNTGRCEAKQDTLAKGVEASERSVRAHLGALEDQGFIARRAQFRIDRGRRGDEYLMLAPGVDSWPDGERIVRVQPADVAGGAESSGGTEQPQAPAGSGTPPGVSKLPGKNDRCGTTTQNNQPSASGRAKEEQATVHRLPVDLPEYLHDAAIAAGRVLYRTATARGQHRVVLLEAVGRAVSQRPTKDHVAVAEKVEHWLCWGKGQTKPCDDVVLRFRNFLVDAEDVRLPDGSPLAVPAERGPNVHLIRPPQGQPRNSNGKPTHAELIGELRAANPRLHPELAANQLPART